MNKRIKELLEQAKELVRKELEYHPAALLPQELVDAKFAELIVRETLDQVSEFSRLTKAYQTQGIDPEIDVTKEVLKNFGFTRFPRS